MRRLSKLVWLVAATPFAIGLTADYELQEVVYGRDILPNLKGRCGSCHAGPSAAAGLDLTTIDGMRRSKVVKAGDPDNSTLVRRLRGLDGKPQMPMGFVPLDEREIQLIRKWIAAGARIEDRVAAHWAFEPVERPAVPVLDDKWVRNPIDAFVLHRLRTEKIQPSPDAVKETLLRRVSLDLTGLPPTLEELDAYLKDGRPDAYERVVDRLLASPHYGERQAQFWLDLARYADSNGYEVDRTRAHWRYRDWVIAAFNTNMPYDRFSIEQLAGDLLPQPTAEQFVATGFHRNTMWNEEGGVDPAEAMFETISDRVATTATVWLGVTMACAKCHDHKFDPITQKDYYRMYAFFANNAFEAQGDHNVGQRKFFEPTMPLPAPEDLQLIADREEELRDLDAELETARQGAKARVSSWEEAARKLKWTNLTTRVTARAGSVPAATEDGGVRFEGPTPDQEAYTLEFDLPDGQTTGVRLEALPDPVLVNKGPGRSSSGNFILSKVVLTIDDKPVTPQFAASFVQDGYALSGLLDDLPDTGWALYPQLGIGQELIMAFPACQGGKAKLVLRMDSATWPKHVIGKLRISTTDAQSPERFAMTEEVRKALAAGDKAILESHYEKVDPILADLRARRMRTKAVIDQTKAAIPHALILRERSDQLPLKARIHNRGEFTNLGDEVEAGTPAFLPAMPPDLPVNRLGLAKWLFGPSQPLTARVQVNRMWAQYFGTGLSETLDDFGTQGSRPTHPELLDWLASELVSKKWDLKAIHRLIVTSSTYRQSSRLRPDLQRIDPANSLLARGPRFRMDAEMIRDQALIAAGILERKIGGPSVMPHQPEGVWDSPYSGERWQDAQGAEARRRGLYTFWKRTSPYPSFAAFDAGSRESCIVRRTRTNTPLQALALLNDPVYLDAARALGQRMASKQNDHDRVRFGFRLVTSRNPTKDEEARLVSLLASLRAKYEKDQAAASKIAGSPDVAALAMTASVLLNLDEAITRD